MLITVHQMKKMPQFANVGLNTIYSAVKTGEIPSKKIGTRRLVIIEKALEWLDLPDPIEIRMPLLKNRKR